MDIIKNKILLYNQIIPQFVGYVEKLSTSYKHIYDLIATVNEYLNNINTNMKLLSEMTIDNPDGMFKIIQYSNNIDGYLEYVYNKLNINLKDMPTEMSNTFLLDVDQEFQHIVVKYAILVNDNKINSEKLIHIFLNKLMSTPVKTIHELFSKYQNTVDLYMHYMQYKLNMTSPSSSDYIVILDLLEEAKVIVINNVKLKGKMTSVDKNTILQRYGLFPMWQHMDEKSVMRQALDLLKYDKEKPRNPGRMYGGGYTTEKLTEMSNIFKEKKLGLYVMVLISSNQIEFDYRILTNRKMLEKYPVSENAGLNDTILHKFDTIKDITTDHNEPYYKNIRLGRTDSDKWLIIRTMNGTHYDIMGLDKDNMFVNKPFIDKLERGPSLLIDTYQRICSSLFTPHLKPVKEVILDSLTPFQNISNTVIRKVGDYIELRLSVIPTNLKELYNMVIGDEIEDIVSSVIIESYEDLDKESGTPELSSTFLYNADKIIKSFVKEVKERFAKAELNEYMFKEKTQSALISHIRTNILRIIKASVEKTFDADKDIYEKLLVKKILLNIEL